MTSKADIEKSLKELSDKLAMGQQVLILKESTALWLQTRLESLDLDEKITIELIEFIHEQIRCNNLLIKLFLPSTSDRSHLMEQWRLVRDKLEVLDKDKKNFLVRYKLTLADFQTKDAEWSNPSEVEDLEFEQEMSPTQREELIKTCNMNDKIAQEAMTTFETLQKDWDVIKADLQVCIEQLENFNDIYHATENSYYHLNVIVLTYHIKNK